MVIIDGIYFPDSEFTLKQVQDILKLKKTQDKYFNIKRAKYKKEIILTLIVPTIKPTKRRLIKLVDKKEKKDLRQRDWRHKYPPCPGCKAIGQLGLTTTRLGSLRCRSCNSMFELKHDKLWNIKVGKSMGD